MLRLVLQWPSLRVVYLSATGFLNRALVLVAVASVT